MKTHDLHMKGFKLHFQFIFSDYRFDYFIYIWIYRNNSIDIYYGDMMTFTLSFLYLINSFPSLPSHMIVT